MRHDRRCFGRLEQEDQRLKKHYGRWMDIVRSLELESCILTRLTKPSVPVNLVGPQVSLPPRWVPASRGSIHFFYVIRRHFRWVQADSRGNIFSQNTVARPVGPSSQGETIFSQNTGGPSGGSVLLWETGARRPEVEEALWPLDGHHTVTGVLTKLTKPSSPST